MQFHCLKTVNEINAEREAKNKNSKKSNKLSDQESDQISTDIQTSNESVQILSGSAEKEMQTVETVGDGED